MSQSASTFGVIVICSLFAASVLGDVASQRREQAARQPAQPVTPNEPLVTASTERSDPRQPAASLGNGLASFSLQRAPDSHFYADVEVNGAMVHFMVDTGATSVVLAPGDAQRIGISGDNYVLKATGAGGELQLMPIIADRVALGPLVADKVPMLVAKDKLTVSLLGQSYLSRIKTVSISGDTMTLQ